MYNEAIKKWQTMQREWGNEVDGVGDKRQGEKNVLGKNYDQNGPMKTREKQRTKQKTNYDKLIGKRKSGVKLRWKKKRKKEGKKDRK